MVIMGLVGLAQGETPGCYRKTRKLPPPHERTKDDKK